jgi:hypothetical protein
MVLLVAKGSVLSTTFHYPDSIFYTACGERYSSVNVDSDYSRIAQIFKFDGQYWCCTGDSC